MAYSRKSYVGGAPAAKLSGSLSAGVLTMTLTNTTGAWSGLGGSGGTSLPFYLSIDYGLSTEEKVLVTSSDISWASGTVSLTIIRGQDGTTDQYHADQATVVPVMTANDLDEANYAVAETVGKVTGAGQVLYGDAVNSIAVLAAGTAGQFLKSNGSGAPSWMNTSGLWTATSSTSTGPSVTTATGFTKYVVLAWSKMANTHASVNTNLTVAVRYNSTDYNPVIQTIQAGSQNGTLATFWYQTGLTAASTYTFQCNTTTSGGTPANWASYIIVIGLN